MLTLSMFAIGRHHHVISISLSIIPSTTIPLRQNPPNIQNLPKRHNHNRSNLQYIPPNHLGKRLFMQLPMHHFTLLHKTHMIHQHLKILIEMLRQFG